MYYINACKKVDSLLVLGCGGHGKVIAETIILEGIYKKLAFIDDIYKEPGEKIFNLPLIGKLESVFNKKILKDYPNAIVGIGDSILRIRWLNILKNFGFKIPIIKHPTAWVAPSSKIEYGTVIFANSTVQTNTCIKRGVIINTASSIDHDCLIGEGTHICPGVNLAGDIKIGNNCFIGIGSSISNGITIKNNVILGGGSFLMNDLPENTKALGVPARISL